MKTPGIVRFFDRWLFRPGDLHDLALVRIVIVGAQLLLFYPPLQVGLARAAAPADQFFPLPALKVLLLTLGGWGFRPDATLVHGIWIAGILAGAFALVGKYTNASLLVFAAAVTFLVGHDYSFGEVHHTTGLMAIMLWVLAMSPCGRRWSLDDLQWRLRHTFANGAFRPRSRAQDFSEFARWPLVVGQWLLALAYLSAGVSKIVHGGLDWFGSSTLAHYLVQDGVRWNMPLGLILAGHPYMLVALAIVTVLFEATFFMAILVTRTAWVYVLTGVALHIGILVTMRAPFIQWIVLYIVFINVLRTTFPFRAWRASAAARSYALIYDGACRLCIRSMTVLEFLDGAGRLRFVDLASAERAEVAPSLTTEEALHAIHVVSPDGAVLSGYAAFVRLSRALPALWLAYPLTRLPLMNRAGPRVYAAIARRRKRRCADGACALHPANASPTAAVGA